MTRPRRRAAPVVLLALAVAAALPGAASARTSIFYDEQDAVRVLTDPSGAGDPIDASRGALRQDPGAGGVFDPAGNDAAHRIAKLAAGEIEGLSPEAMADRIEDEIDDPEIPNTSGLVAIDEIGNRWNDGKVRITYSFVRVRGKRIRVATGNKIVVTRKGWKLVKGAAALPAVDPSSPGAKLSTAMDLLAARPYPGGGTYAERVHLYIAPAFSTSIAAGRGPHRHLGNDGKPHRATWRGVMPAVAKAGGVWLEMYHHDGTLTSMTAKEWRTVPRGFASYADALRRPDRPDPPADRRHARPRRVVGVRRGDGLPVGPGGVDAHRAGHAGERPGGLSSGRAGGRLAGRVQPRPPGALGDRLVHYSPATPWAVAAPLEARGRTTHHRARTPGGHRLPQAAGAPAAACAAPAALARPPRRPRPGGAARLGAGRRVGRPLLLAVGPALPRVLHRPVRPGEHGPGRLEHGQRELPGHHGRLRGPVQPPRGPRRPGAGPVRAALDGLVEPRDAVGGPGGDRRRGCPARVLAGTALAGRRPPGRGRRGGLPDGAGPDARHAVRLPPGHARGAAPDVLHLGGGGGALGHPGRLRHAGGAVPGAGGPADRRARGLAVVPPPGPAAGGPDPGRRGARVGGDRLRGDPAVVRARRRQPAPDPLLVAGRQPGRDPPELRDPSVGRGRDRPDARPPRLRARPAGRHAVPGARGTPPGPGGPAAAGDQPVRQHGPGADRRVPLRGAAGARPGGGRPAGAGEPARAGPAQPVRPGARGRAADGHGHRSPRRC